MKDRLSRAPIFTLPKVGEPFTIYIDASGEGYGCVLMQNDRVIVHFEATRSHEKNYATHDL